MQNEDERRTADRCGYSRKRLLIEYYQDYFSKVLKKARPTVKECLEYDEFLSLWLISKDYDVAQTSQCILEKDYDSLHNLIEDFMEKKEEIIRNKIKCKKCGDIIESKSTNDYKKCSCGAVAVDGGAEYLKRIGNENDYIELSISKDNNR